MTSETATVRLGESDKLRILVQRIKDLPTVPSVLAKLVSLSLYSSLNADSLSKIVNVDQTISAKLLRVANSAFYGCRGKVTSVSRAIMVLGFNEVESLALGMSIFQAFSNAEGKKGLISMEKLWKHSMATGAVSKYFSAKVPAEFRNSAFTSGLLHDIGKVVFLNSFHEEYKETAKITREKECSIAEAEEDVFQVTHSTIGGWLCKKWHMPEEIVQCVQYHANPSQGEENYVPLVSLIHLANIIVRKKIVGYGGDPQILDVEEGVLDRLRLSKKDIDKGEAFIEGRKEQIEMGV